MQTFVSITGGDPSAIKLRKCWMCKEWFMTTDHVMHEHYKICKHKERYTLSLSACLSGGHLAPAKLDIPEDVAHRTVLSQKETIKVMVKEVLDSLRPRVYYSLEEVPDKYKQLGNIVLIADREKRNPLQMFIWYGDDWEAFPQAKTCPNCGQVMPKKMEVAEDGTILSIT